MKFGKKLQWVLEYVADETCVCETDQDICVVCAARSVLGESNKDRMERIHNDNAYVLPSPNVLNELCVFGVAHSPECLVAAHSNEKSLQR